MKPFSGIWPALVTPLDKEGRIDLNAAETLIESLIAAGVGGLYVCGNTGEGILLSLAQRREMAEVTVRVAAGRVPVMVHVGAINTETAVDLAQHASLAGADAISAIPPFYYAYPFAAILEHYRAIAAVSAAPLYLYYIPSTTGTSISPEQLVQLCALEGVAGLKYSSQDMYALAQLMSMRNPERVNVLSGPDELFLACRVLGCDGAIGTTYNFMPRTYMDIDYCIRQGDLATARSLQFAANRIIAVLLRYGVIPATKALLGMLGYHVGYGVPPMPPIAGGTAKRLRKDLEDAGLFDLVKRNALHAPTGDPLRGKLA